MHSRVIPIATGFFKVMIKTMKNTILLASILSVAVSPPDAKRNNHLAAD